MTTPKPRFIAGAVCPQCKRQDKIVVFSRSEGDDNVDVRRCVSCGFEEEKNFLTPNMELPTRVRQARPKAEDKEEVVTFVKGETLKGGR